MTRRAVVRNPAVWKSVVEEVIRLLPAQQIKLGAGGQEIETPLRQIKRVFADQNSLKCSFQLVQIQHVGRGIVLLRLGQIDGPPVTGLLRLRYICRRVFHQQVLQPVAEDVSKAQQT